MWGGKSPPYSLTEQELSFHPHLLPLTRPGYAAALFNACFNSPQQSPPSIRSSSFPFPPHFLFTLYSSCFLLCIGSFHYKSQVASCSSFIFKKYCFPYNPLIDSSLFLSSVSMMFIALFHSVFSFLHLVVAAFEPRENSSGNRLPFTSAKWGKMIAAKRFSWVQPHWY